MIIFTTPRFIKEYSKLSKEIKLIFEKKELIFRSDPFDQRLKTHKLHGKFSGACAFSLNYKYRVIFDFVENGKNVRLLTIGTHDIYE